MFIKRLLTEELLDCVREYPVVTILGPRQSGKTTLVRSVFPDKSYFSLEDPEIRLAAEMDPRAFLSRLEQGAILDEIQRVPILLSYIQGIVDNVNEPGMFILTGSHQPDLQSKISQSLAGRTAILHLLPLALEEIEQVHPGPDVFDWLVKGCYPRLMVKNLNPERFFNGYVQTYVERDVRALINIKDLSRFQQFLVLLAGRIGQVMNYSSLANDVGVSSTVIKNWISVLKASFIVFELAPYFANIRKRVIKSSKIYFMDTGLAAFLLGIRTAEQAARDPLRGGLYENLIILEVLKFFYNQGTRPDVYFFRDSKGNEVDLLIRVHSRLLPVEIKSAATFSRDFLKGIKRFQSITSDCLEYGVVLYNGEEQFQIHNIQVFNPIKRMQELKRLLLA